MIEHCAHPEAWDTEWAILDFLDVARDGLQLLEVFVIEFLSTGLIDLKELLLWCLSTCEDFVSLYVDLLVEFVILELKSTVKCLLFLVKFALSILLII